MSESGFDASGASVHAGLKSGLGARNGSPAAAAGIGIFIQDPKIRRLLASVAIQLDLVPTEVRAHSEAGALELDSLTGFELVIADMPRAIEIQSFLRKEEEKTDSLHPTLIAIRRPGLDMSLQPNGFEQEFGGVLKLPEDMAVILAHLSVILQAHRAFRRRYLAALEELHLNRSIFRSLTSGISVATTALPDMPLTYVNPAFEAMTGYNFEEIKGKNCRFLQGEDHDQPGLTLMREAIKAQRQIVVILKNYHKSGTLFWNEVSLSPIHNMAGDVTHFVGIQSDVTTRVEIEATLRESEKLAAVGRLAASIAHEINNPLEAVTNLLYLAQQADEIPEIKSYLSQADKELLRASLITSQSLRFSRQSTRPEVVRLTEVLESVLDLYQGKLNNARVLVEREGEDARFAHMSRE